MKYAAEIGSGAMVYVRSFITVGSDVQKLIEGIHSHIYSMEVVYWLGYFSTYAGDKMIALTFAWGE
jgi:hypothetical protein